MSAVKIKIPEDNVTTFLMMRNHFKKIYNVKCYVSCWPEPRPSNRLIKNEYFNIRNNQVLPHYCSSTISSMAKKSKNVNHSLLNKKKQINRNLSYNSTVSPAYNNDDFGFRSVENNSRSYYPKDECSDKKNNFFQNTIDNTNESYQQFLEDITNEILRLNLNTNKALKNVFQKHIKHNSEKLEKKKMIAEIKKIQLLLDLPSDNEDK